MCALQISMNTDSIRHAHLMNQNAETGLPGGQAGVNRWYDAYLHTGFELFCEPPVSSWSAA